MKNIIVSLICGLLGAMIFTLVNNHLYARPIAVVKLDEIIASHLREYGERELTEEQQREVSERFAKSLDQVIKRVADEHKVTLLVSPAVVSDVPDYTSYVKSEVGRMVDGN